MSRTNVKMQQKTETCTIKLHDTVEFSELCWVLCTKNNLAITVAHHLSWVDFSSQNSFDWIYANKKLSGFLCAAGCNA